MRTLYKEPHFNYAICLRDDGKYLLVNNNNAVVMVEDDQYTIRCRASSICGIDFWDWE
jgi:hypothetical protein